MHAHFRPGQGSAACWISASSRTDPEALGKDAAMRLLQEDARFRGAVPERLAQAHRGESIAFAVVSTPVPFIAASQIMATS
jgi:hypothetical protein